MTQLDIIPAIANQDTLESVAAHYAGLIKFTLGAIEEWDQADQAVRASKWDRSRFPFDLNAIDRAFWHDLSVILQRIDARIQRIFSPDTDIVTPYRYSELPTYGPRNGVNIGITPNYVSNSLYSTLVALTVMDGTGDGFLSRVPTQKLEAVLHTPDDILRFHEEVLQHFSSDELKKSQKLCIKAEEMMEAYYTHRALETYEHMRLSGSIRRLPAGAPYEEKLEKLAELFADFPYLYNYEHLPRAEIDTIVEALSRTGQDFSGHFLSQEQASIERLFTPNTLIAIPDARDFPISGIFYHLLTGASIACIEPKEVARNACVRLVAALEDLGVIRKGAITVHPGPHEFYQTHKRNPDITLISGYVGDPTRDNVMFQKAATANNFKDIPDSTRTQATIFRDADGLVEFLYPKIDREYIQQHTGKFGAKSHAAHTPMSAAEVHGAHIATGTQDVYNSSMVIVDCGQENLRTAMQSRSQQNHSYR